MGFLLRTHRPSELVDAARWFDEETTAVLRSIVLLDRLTPEASILMQLPLLEGGLGIRSQERLAAFCRDCVFDKGKQKELTAALDEELLDTLNSILLKDTVSMKVLESNRSVGGRRAFSDPSFTITDVPFRLALLQRLLLRAVHSGVRCVCGKSDATNAHVNTCPATAAARTHRHNAVQHAVANWCQEMGYQTRLEVPAGNGTKRRIDITMSSLTASFATDVAVCYPGQVAADPFAKVGDEKMRDWARWAATTGCEFKPFVMASTGEMAPYTLRLVHALAGSRPHPYTPQTAAAELLGAVARAVLSANTLMFAMVDRTWYMRRRDPTAVTV